MQEDSFQPGELPENSPGPPLLSYQITLGPDTTLPADHSLFPFAGFIVEGKRPEPS